VEIEHDQIHLLRPCQGEGSFTVRGRHDDIALFSEHALENLSDRAIVFNDEDRLRRPYRMGSHTDPIIAAVGRDVLCGVYEPSSRIALVEGVGSLVAVPTRENVRVTGDRMIADPRRDLISP
jgi:hypothetical protein